MRIVFLIVLLIIAGIIFSTFFFFTETITDKKTCFANTDCVPDQCCHPTDVVNRLYSPNCLGIGCTAVCARGTMDCGCGKPACIEGKCQVVWTRNEDFC